MAADETSLMLKVRELNNHGPVLGKLPGFHHYSSSNPTYGITKQKSKNQVPIRNKDKLFTNYVKHHSATQYPENAVHVIFPKYKANNLFMRNNQKSTLEKFNAISFILILGSGH